MIDRTLPWRLAKGRLRAGRARIETVSGAGIGDVWGALVQRIGTVWAAVSMRQRQVQGSSRFAVLRLPRGRTRCTLRSAIAGWARVAGRDMTVARNWLIAY